MSPHVNLWCAVMYEALMDAREWYPPRRQNAVDWFLDTGAEPGSFLWICTHVGLDPDIVLKRLMAVLVMPTQADWDRHRKMDRRRKHEQSEEESGGGGGDTGVPGDSAGG